MSDTRTTDAPEPANGDWDCTPDDAARDEASLFASVLYREVVIGGCAGRIVEDGWRKSR